MMMLAKEELLSLSLDESPFAACTERCKAMGTTMMMV